MRRGFLIGVLASLLCVSPALVAQRGGGGIELHGIPASVTDPGRNGVPRGVPASVTDPTPRTNFGRVPGNFNGHGHHHGTPVYALPYYGYYGGYYDYSDYAQYDPTQAQQAQAQPQPQPQPQVIIVREEPAQDDDESRYGQHSFEEEDDSNTRVPAHNQVAQARPAPAPQPSPDDSPATVLVYRDGHKSEIRNYAIIGSNLVDLTKSPVLKKIPLDSLDLDATRKANEDNGVDFHTP